ncbi:unnamed protein product, partial [Rotaria sp. Silwood1]
TTFKSFLNCFIPYDRLTLGENNFILFIDATIPIAVRRPTPLPPAGRILTRLTSKDLGPFIERGITRYRSDYRDTDVFIFRE